MELRTLRYFCTAAEMLHFSRAAEACGVTQPALSHQIKHLEDLIGCRLFVRSSRQVTLTPAGLAFFEHSRLALDTVATAISAAQQAANCSKELRVGVWSHFLLSRILPEVLPRLKKESLGQPISIHEMWGQDLFTALDEGRLDLAIAGEIVPRRGYTMIPLFMEGLVLGVRRDDPLARRQTLSLEELDGMSIAALSRDFPTRLALEQALVTVNAKPVFVAEMSTPETMRNFAIRAGVPLVVPFHAFDGADNMVLVRLVNPTPCRPMMLMTRESTALGDTAQRLIGEIRKSWDALQTH
jgi:DNA-binding transcriptional LysR family regulator